jgi:hypothetical protein
MEAEFIYKKLFPEKSLPEISVIFFSEYTPQSAHFLLLKIFQCWGINDCTLRAEISNEEIALFLDQLMDLVAAAYILHQANRVLQTEKGIEHE